MLTPLHVQDVCYGAGWTQKQNQICKYLDNTTRSDGKWVPICTKHSKTAYDALKKKQLGGQAWQPKGDNCQGYLLLMYKQQGYDV